MPKVRVSTSDARKSLTDIVNFGDVVFNLGRSALIAILSWGMDDRTRGRRGARAPRTP